MEVIRDDLWLCTDCAFAAEAGDFTGLQYHYTEDEAAARKATILDGLERLGPHLVLDYDSETEFGHDPFSRGPCDCCGTPLHGARYKFAVLG